jgi:hypothetical protein
MQGKYENNPIYKLYLHFYREMDLINIDRIAGKYISGFDEYDCCTFDKLDEVLKLILLNNGCKISDSNEPIQSIHTIIPDEYQICFITGMIGNDANEYYDFVIFNGMKILVVFLDYFNGMIDGNLDKNNPFYQIQLTMGNSVYYDAIKKIVEIFYLTSEPTPAGILTTAMATTHRWNQAIIAITILNNVKPVDEYDISDIPMEDVRKILDADIKLQLYGIRTM